MISSVQDFRPQDAATLVPMWRASFKYGVGIVDPHTLEEQTEYLLSQVVPNNRVQLAWANGEIVGFIASTAESVTQLHVRVQNICHGIGTALLNLAKSESSGSLWLYTFAQNINARRFYEQRGFVAIEHGFEPTWQLADVKYLWARAGGVA